MNTYILFLLIIVIWLTICFKVIYSLMDDDDDILSEPYIKLPKRKRRKSI